MRTFINNFTVFFLCVTVILILCLNIFIGTAIASDSQISIRKMTGFVENPEPPMIYDHIMIKIRAYKTFRIALRVHMYDDVDNKYYDMWIYYSSTDTEPYQDYEDGPIHVGLGSSLVDKNWHLLNLDTTIDLGNFVVLDLKSIQEIEFMGNRFDLAYLLAYRILPDGSHSNILIDDFSLPGQDLIQKGWVSEDMDKFSIAYDSDMQGYLKSEYTTTQTDANDSDEDDEEEDQDQTQYTYYGYSYPYGTYYGSGYYGGGYYGGGYYGGGYYGGGYYGGGYYGGGYYGGLYGLGGYSGFGLYGGGLYGGGYYGGLYGLGSYGGFGLYGGGLYGGLGFGLRNYYGGPIGFGGFISPFV